MNINYKLSLDLAIICAIIKINLIYIKWVAINNASIQVQKSLTKALGLITATLGEGGVRIHKACFILTWENKTINKSL